MKKIYIKSLIVILGFSSTVYADCSTMPVGMELEKSIESKEISTAQGLLTQYKDDIKKYLAACDQSKEKFEETSVMIHTYEDRLADVEYDMKHANHTTNCSKVPSSSKLEAAFTTKDAVAIETQYISYKKAAADYIEYCASHSEYETVYEASMFCDESYDEWKAKHK